MQIFRIRKFRTGLVFCLTSLAAAQTAPAKFPYAEKLVYKVGWRMVTAGEADLKLAPSDNNGWQLDLQMTSLGLVNQLYRVLDNYKLLTNDKFCGVSANLDALESKHHTITTLVFDNQEHKVHLTTKDLVGTENKKSDVDIPPCVYDIAGALMTLRASQLAPGMKFNLPVTDGKKLADVRVEGLNKEKLTLAGKQYNTIRYETFVFGGILYRRKGRLLMWITDDAQRLPVQMRFVFGFPLGDITLELEKVERL
jgi:hypothetical protein